MNIKPALIQNLNTDQQAQTFLKPVSIDTPPYDEEWLQRLIHDNPNLIPASEIEACFDTLVPVMMEYALPSGYLDNFFVTPDGYPVLVEVKLWKNQEARRKVVAQILEYAKDFAALSYDDLNAEFIKKNPGSSGKDNPIYEAVASYAPDAPNETIFVDRISRNLREGRFLLLIVGDGIREELVNLAKYLLHHSLRYAFGLVQVKLFDLPDGNVVALPLVMAKTQTVERHVTVVSTQGDNISVTAKPPVFSERTEKTSLSTDEFYERLAAVSPQAVSWLKTVVSRLEDIPVELSVGGGDYASLIAPLSGGKSIILAKINLKNTVEFWGIPNKNRKVPAWSDLSHEYLSSLAAIVPGATVKTFESGHMDIKNADTGKPLPLEAFFGKENELVDVMRRVVTEAEDFYQKEAA